MSYQLIETITLSSDSAGGLEFTGLPDDGTDLIVKISMRQSTTSNTQNWRAGPDTSTWETQDLRGEGSDEGAYDSHNLSWVDEPNNYATSNTTANRYLNAEFVIGTYSDTGFSSTWLSRYYVNASGASKIGALAALQNSLRTSAVGTFQIRYNLQAGTTASIYKITRGEL